MRARQLAGLRRKWRQLRLQPRRGHWRLQPRRGGTGGSDVGGGIGDWDASSGTGSGDTCGGCEAVEDPKKISRAVLSWAKTH